MKFRSRVIPVAADYRRSECDPVLGYDNPS